MEIIPLTASDRFLSHLLVCLDSNILVDVTVSGVGLRCTDWLAVGCSWLRIFIHIAGLPEKEIRPTTRSNRSMDLDTA